MGEYRYLSKREQQIMEIVHNKSAVTVSEVEEALPGKPANSTVRTLMMILERKGLLERAGASKGAVLYKATDSQEEARTSALDRLTQTLFQGSVSSVVSTLLNARKDKMSRGELEELEKLIRKAKEEDR
jgi:predicted transcriptional regulator